MDTGSSAFLDALVEAGVRYVFANLGSDHSGLIEALAEKAALRHPAPTLVTCPNEMVALSAAHGYAQVSGVAQAVVVHVECGTQALAGALHNSAKGRVPVLIFAGASPVTQRGEMKGSRNEFIHWIQDAFDQRGLVRGYTKYTNEFRTAKAIKQITHRALQMAYSDPQGPVYLMGAREIMEEPVANESRDPTRGRSLCPSGLSEAAISRITEDLLRARRPLVVTSYIGRNPNAVSELLVLCERLGIGVLESVPNYVNFPHDNPLYLGNQWNEPKQNPLLAEADTILVIDSDVPWIPLFNQPGPGAAIHHIDVDPLKQQMPAAVIHGGYVYQADAETALGQINARVRSVNPVNNFSAIDERREHYMRHHADRVARLDERERTDGDVLTSAYLTASLRLHVDSETVVLSEGISNYPVICDHLQMTRSASLFTSGGGSLGWSGGAAIGVKLAFPKKTVINVVGDGSYLLSVPSSVHWMARRYKTPFLQVIYNNGGWKSPKLSTLAVHPDGYASRSADLGVSFDQPPDYSGIAASAGGAFARVVRRVGELDDALQAALNAVRVEQRCAVLDVHLPHL